MGMILGEGLRLLKIDPSPDSSGNPVIVRLQSKLAMTDCNG